MRNLVRASILIGLFLFAMIALVGCSNRFDGPEDPPPSAQIGATYYTQVGMYYEKGHYRTTNYGVGVFLPMNSAVELIEFGRKSFTVAIVKTGETVECVNYPKHTNWSLVESFDKLFSPQKVSLLKFNANERKYIESGQISKGMSKAAVIAARGYPPSHETPSLQRDQWKYWKNRWDTIIVKFKNDRVENIKD